MKSLKEYILEGLLDIEDNINYDIKEDVIEQFLKENYNIKGSYTIKETKNGFIVDVKGNVIVKNENITTLTNEFFEFGEVSGDFNCYYCRYLTSLKGAPKKTGGYFYCNYCNSLKSLEGAPKEVGRDFECAGCSSLISLKGAPKEVKWNFNCNNCESLKTLEGAPEKVGQSFYCDGCKSLKSLEGAPKEVGGNFGCKWCGIKFSAWDVRKYTKVNGVILT